MTTDHSPTETRNFTHDDIVVGRILFEDADFVTVEFAKDQDRQISGLRNGDRFETVIFTGGKPWEKRD